MFTLDAASLSSYQSCRRRYVLSLDWQYARWRPRSLFSHCLRRGVAALAAGRPAADVATDAETEFYTAAATPGLDVIGVDPYRIAADWTAMLQVVLLTLGRSETNAATSAIPTAVLTPSVSWRPSAQQGGDDRLHRWVVADRWDESALTRELHSWWTIGDVAVLRRPMRLHVVVIGQSRNGRHSSAWSRAWRHPGLRHLPLRFRLSTGKPPKDWRPVHLADVSDVDPADWAEQAWREGATQELLRTADVAVPSAATCDDTVRQIAAEAWRMESMVKDWRQQAMSRGACDGFVPCPYAACCYSEGLVNVDDLGLYSRRAKSPMTAPDISPVEAPC